MFELTTQTPAILTSVTPRTETHGDDKVFAISLGLKLTGPNTLLDKLSPTLRTTLYRAVEGQGQLPGVEESTPLLRTRGIESLSVAGKLEGWTLRIDHGIDEDDPIEIGGCKVDKFRVEPFEGGSVELTFRVGSKDIDATEAGLLCSHLSQEISVTLTAPEKPAEAIDGSVAAFKADHPVASAEDLFGAGADDFDPLEPDEEDDGDEGSHPDVEAGGDDEGAPADLEDRLDGALRGADQPVSTAPRPPRTARGRAATKAALEAGAAGL